MADLRPPTPKALPRCQKRGNNKVPLSGVVYEREQRQCPSGTRGWRNVVFYIRGIDDQRIFYANDIRASNRLFKLGIWDEKEHTVENPPHEWAFSTEKDQVAMFRVILKNIVSPIERKKFVSKILGVIKDFGMQVRLT